MMKIVNFPFLDGDVPCSPSYGVYILQLICFARVCSHVDDFNNRNKCLTSKLLKQGHRYHKLHKAISKFYNQHSELLVKGIYLSKALTCMTFFLYKQKNVFLSKRRIPLATSLY